MNWESFLKPFQSKTLEFFFNLEENESPALLRKTNVSRNTSQRLARNWASSKSGLFTLYIFWFCRMLIFFQFWNQHKDSEFVLILKQRGITISSSFKIYHNPMCGRSFVDLWKLNLWHCHVTHIGPVHKLCRLKIGNFWPPPSPLVVSFIKVHIFWEGHKILRNLPLTFDCKYVQ